MRRQIWLALATTLIGLPAAAQSEEALQRAFETKYVRVKLDMPATQQGVDLRFDREQPFNSQEHFQRIKNCDVAVAEGQRVQVSHVHIKGDHIEFQLAGGGFNWITDSTTRSFSPASKSDREKDLEKRVKEETDRRQKRDLQDDLDHVRRERERRDDRERREVEDYNVEARERDRERALRSGSRFNLRFKKRVPPDALTPEGLMRYLEPWAEPDEGRSRR